MANEEDEKAHQDVASKNKIGIIEWFGTYYGAIGALIGVVVVALNVQTWIGDNYVSKEEFNRAVRELKQQSRSHDERLLRSSYKRVKVRILVLEENLSENPNDKVARNELRRLREEQIELTRELDRVSIGTRRFLYADQ